MIDLKDIRGQENIKRAFEIACSGNHSLLLVGPAKWEANLLISAFECKKAAWKPTCRCGNYNHPQKECTCSPDAIKGYWKKNNHLLLFDIIVEILPTSINELLSHRDSESTEIIAKRISDARNKFSENNSGTIEINILNCLVRSLSESSKQILKMAFEKLQLPSQRISSIINVARTISFLDKASSIQPVHIAEAIQYSSFTEIRNK